MATRLCFSQNSPSVPGPTDDHGEPQRFKLSVCLGAAGGYLLILQLGSVVCSSVMPASVIWVRLARARLSRFVSPLRWTSPASVTWV